jgi:glycosyltransferase involved in cell wall biosynthesis
VFGVSGEPTSGPPPAGVEVWQRSSDATLSDPPATASAALRWVRDGGHPYDRYLTDSTMADLEALLEGFRPDAAVVETLSLYRYVEVLKQRGLPVALDAHDVETPLHQGMVELRARAGGVPPLVASVARRHESVERAAFETADQVWACSHRDAKLIRRLFRGSAPVEVVPNTIDVDGYVQSSATSARKPHSVVFSGSFGYPPNAQAALWLGREVLPQLASRFSDAQLALVGRAPTREMLALAGEDPRITIAGDVPDVRPHLAEASVMAVPLFVGSGTRFKVLEGFASRLPVVSTAKGMEGLDVRAGQHYLAGETADSFASAVVALWSDSAVAEGLAERALACVRERYSWPVSARRIQAALARLGGAG